MEKRDQVDQWELPKHKRYRVREIKGSEGKEIREGTVTCQSGNFILVNLDDGWARRSTINNWVRLYPPPTETAVGATVVYQ